jgi:cytochrome P450
LETIDLASYDPTDAAVQQSPFASYAALRRQAPVFRHPQTGVYFVSRFESVRRILGEPDIFSSRSSNVGTPPRTKEALDEMRRIFADALPNVPTMVTADPPEHTRYRRAAARALSPRRIRGMQDEIRSIAVDLLDAWPKSGRVDVMNTFSIPFPVRVILRILGIKEGREAEIKRWSDDTVVTIGADVPDARRIEAVRGIVELQRMWVEEIERRRAEPGDDVVSDLIAAELPEADGSTRSMELPELISIAQQLMVAGNETTTKLVNELVRLLAENPDAWDRVRREPAWIPKVVEEGLRLASPNQGLRRDVVSDTTLDGVDIPAGSVLWIMFGSANRDESVFPDPDRFDPDRENLGEHLAFGYGPHFCIGAPLARLEARIVLEELAKRVETLRLPEGAVLRYEPSYILRGLAGLEVEIA